MSVGQGSITRTTKRGAPSGFVNIAGARDGVSLDSTSHVVLGEDVGDGAMPAVLTSSREIPMDNFFINWFNGCSVFSTAGAATPVAALVEVQGLLGQAGTEEIVRIACDSTFAGSAPVLLQLDATAPAPAGIATPGAFMAATLNGVQTFLMDYDGQTFWKNLTTGNIFLAISDDVELLGAVGQAVLQFQPTYNTGLPAGIISDITMQGHFTAAGGALGLTQVLQAPQVNQTAGSTGKIVGIQFNPGITSVTGQLIAYENTIGDVLLQSNGTTGRTGVHNNSTLSAWLHIGPGVAAAGGGPLKLTAGTLLTVPEDGTIEYDGTNFYKTIGVTRTIIL
jgi:hypothetical protein